MLQGSLFPAGTPSACKKVPPPRPSRDCPPRQPAGHGTDPADPAQTRQTAPSEEQLKLCASAPSAVLRHPLRHGSPQAPQGDKHLASGTDSELCNQKSLQENPDFSTSFDVTLICGNVFKQNAHAALLPAPPSARGLQRGARAAAPLTRGGPGAWTGGQLGQTGTAAELRFSPVSASGPGS